MQEETKRRLGLAIRIAVIAAVAAGLWWFVRRLDVAALGRSLASARIAPLVAGAVLHFALLACKAASWRILLAPRHVVPVPRLFRYTIAAFAASAIMPARAGEVLRVWALDRRDGVPATDSAAVAVAEKLLDAMSLLVLLAPLPWLLPDLPAWIGGSIAAASGAAIVLFAVAYAASGRVDPAGSSVLQRFFAGMRALRSGRRLLGAFGALLLSWLLDLAMVSAVMYAVDLEVSIPVALLVLGLVNLAILFPSTPAQVGALEVGALEALHLVGIPHEPALAFALLYHAVQIIPLIAVGLILELPLILRRG